MATRSKKNRVEAFVLIVVAFIALAGLGAVLVTPEPALAHNTGESHSHGGRGNTFESVHYWVSFIQPDPLVPILIADPCDPSQLAGRLEDPEFPRILVNAVDGGLRPYLLPKSLQTVLTSYIAPTVGAGDFDTAFRNPEYGGTLNLREDGETVTMSFTALSLKGKKLEYRLTAYTYDTTADPVVLPDWDPLSIAPGESATISLWQWELEAPRQPDRGAHAVGDFQGNLKITLQRFTDEEEAIKRGS